MWCLIRVMQFQEECMYMKTSAEVSVNKYLLDGDLFVSIRHFVLQCTTFNLLLAFLPKRFRGNHKPSHIDKYGKQVRVSKIREIDSIIRYALDGGYIESSLDREKVDGKEYHTRVSPKGDNFATYWGGFEALISSYPRTWVVVVAAISSPIWVPILRQGLISPVCQFLSWC